MHDSVPTNIMALYTAIKMALLNIFQEVFMQVNLLSDRKCVTMRVSLSFRNCHSYWKKSIIFIHLNILFYVTIRICK